MAGATTKAGRPKARAHAILRARLAERRPEIEQVALTRVKAIADPSDAADPAYVEGLHGAVASAVDFGLAATDAGGEQEPPVPVALLAQARSAARSGVSLETVLRRYFAGYSLLGYFIIEEASRDDLLSAAELQRLLARQAVLFDKLLAAVGEEHGRESEGLALSSQRRQIERIERLLEGELIDTSRIAYDFGGWHVGVALSGSGAEAAARALGDGLDCRLLLCPREEGACWAWLGTRLPLDPAKLLERIGQLVEQPAIAIGEPGEGLPGWRLSHQQAAVALLVAQRRGGGAVRYRDVALLASVLQDDLLAESLRRLYLGPLESRRDEGESLRETLRAYFASGRNVSSTASALELDRNTIARRLRRAERLIGRPVDSSAASLEAALFLHEIDGTGGAAGR